MKGNDQVIATLNTLLREELTAINQYMVHSEMCANWGYEKLHKNIEKQAIDEMKHAEKLIGRIIFLEGMPVVSKLNDIKIGQDIPRQLEANRQDETSAVASYNAAIKQSTELGDNGTREMLDTILKDEERHLDWLESQLDQIVQMGLQNYLVEQID